MNRFIKLMMLTCFALMLGVFSTAHADGLDLATRNTKNFQTYPGPGTGDLTVVFDASDDKWKTMPAPVAAASDLTAVGSLTSAQCGGTFFLNSATEFATTLPAPSAGCKFRFVVKAAPSGASYTVLTASSANIFIGHVVTADVNSATDADISTADDTITFADGVAAVGDQLELVSDGTSWYYIANTAVYNGIAGTQAS